MAAAGHRRPASPYPRPTGTFYFDNQANILDQFLVNENMLATSAPLCAEPDSVQIVTEVPGTVGTGRYPAPVPFGGMGKKINKDGHSDHYPIAVHIHSAD